MRAYLHQLRLVRTKRRLRPPYISPVNGTAPPRARAVRTAQPARRRPMRAPTVDLRPRPRSGGWQARACAAATASRFTSNPARSASSRAPRRGRNGGAGSRSRRCLRVGERVSRPSSVWCTMVGTREGAAREGAPGSLSSLNGQEHRVSHTIISGTSTPTDASAGRRRVGRGGGDPEQRARCGRWRRRRARHERARRRLRHDQRGGREPGHRLLARR